MAITVDAGALWHTAPVEWCGCDGDDFDWCIHDTIGGWAYPMMKATIDGTLFITDRHVLLPADRVLGWDRIDHPLIELRPQASDGLAEWLTATVLPDASDRVFYRKFIDALEQAGFLIRPLEGLMATHGICDPDLRLVGVVSPVGPKSLTVDAAKVRTAGR